MLLQGQNDAVGYNCSQDHVLKWSVKVKEKFNIKMHSFHSHHVLGSFFMGIPLRLRLFSSTKLKPWITYWLDLLEGILYISTWSFHMADHFQPFSMLGSLCSASSVGHCLQVRAYWGPMNWIQRTQWPCYYNIVFPDNENANVYGSDVVQWGIWFWSHCISSRNVPAYTENLNQKLTLSQVCGCLNLI